jgi:hypothetical protein
MKVLSVIGEVVAERERQNAKWGEQNHPDGTGPHLLLLHGTEVNLDLRSGEELARIFKAKCGGNAPNEDNWRDILLEEVFEALAELDPARLRGELIQVAAVAAAWVEAIDRRAEVAS